MTKKEMFGLIATVCADNAEIVEFCNHEIALLAKKGSGPRKPSKNQLENVAHKEAICAILTEADRPMTVTEILEHLGVAGLTNQRVSALLTQLKNEGKVTRTEVKRKAYFEIVK